MFPPGLPQCPKGHVFRPGGHAERDIGCGAHLERRAASRQQPGQGRILRGAHAVTDPVCVQLRQAVLHAVGSGKLPAVRNGEQASAGGNAERRGELGGSAPALVVAEAEPDDASPGVLCGEWRVSSRQVGAWSGSLR